VTYCCTLDVSRALVRYVAKLLSAERRRLGTRRGTRALTPFHQARFALAYLRDRVEIERLGAGFGLSRATAYRYIAEAVRVLSEQAPDLQEALERAAEDGLSHLILDGTIIECDRLSETKISKKGREIDAWYSGKTRDFGGNIQALMAPNGVPRWVSDVRPGSTHDLTAARELVLAIAWHYTADIPVLADGGYEGAGCGVLTPIPQRTDGIPLHADQRTYNRLLRGLRCLGERGFALLTQRWQTLQRITASPGKIGQIAQAALVLTLFEHKMLT
jgi:hypothetical protein